MYLLLVLVSGLALAGGSISNPNTFIGFSEVSAFERIRYTSFLLAELQRPAQYVESTAGVKIPPPNKARLSYPHTGYTLTYFTIR